MRTKRLKDYWHHQNIRLECFYYFALNSQLLRYKILMKTF